MTTTMSGCLDRGLYWVCHCGKHSKTIEYKEIWPGFRIASKVDGKPINQQEIAWHESNHNGPQSRL